MQFFFAKCILGFSKIHVRNINFLNLMSFWYIWFFYYPDFLNLTFKDSFHANIYWSGTRGELRVGSCHLYIFSNHYQFRTS